MYNYMTSRTFSLPINEEGKISISIPGLINNFEPKGYDINFDITQNAFTIYNNLYEIKLIDSVVKEIIIL